MDEAVNKEESLTTVCKERRKDELNVRVASMKGKKKKTKERKWPAIKYCR